MSQESNPETVQPKYGHGVAVTTATGKVARRRRSNCIASRARFARGDARSEMITVGRPRNRPNLLALPAGVNMSDMDFVPSVDEPNWDRWRGAEVEIQRDFMADSTRKLAAIALIIEKEVRERELTEAQDRIDAWWKETAEKELEENKRLMEMFQLQLDAATYQKLVDRVNEAGRHIKADAAHFEREELKRRGVYKGRPRREFAVIPQDDVERRS